MNLYLFFLSIAICRRNFYKKCFMILSNRCFRKIDKLWLTFPYARKETKKNALNAGPHLSLTRMEKCLPSGLKKYALK